MAPTISFTDADPFIVRRLAIRAVTARAHRMGTEILVRIHPDHPSRCPRLAAAVEAAVLAPEPTAAFRGVLAEHCPKEWAAVAPNAQPFVLALVVRAICAQ